MGFRVWKCVVNIQHKIRRLSILLGNASRESCGSLGPKPSHFGNESNFKSNFLNTISTLITSGTFYNKHGDVYLYICVGKVIHNLK